MQDIDCDRLKAIELVLETQNWSNYYSLRHYNCAKFHNFSMFR